ncbi:hypothetical protein D3C81_2259070 [compost metagenome]
MQLERQYSIAEAHHKGGDGLGGEILCQRLLGGDVLAVTAAVPAEVNGLNPGEWHMHGAIDGGTGRGQ